MIWGDFMDEENVIENEVIEDDVSEGSTADYSDILEHISDSLDYIVLSSSSESLEDSTAPIHTIDDLYNLNSCIFIVCLVMLVLKAFHNIVANIRRL